jgi:predicted DNA-binding ribbon-helix-helix protein
MAYRQSSWRYFGCHDNVASGASQGFSKIRGVRKGGRMCHIFSRQNPANYEGETRSVRIGGHVTSIRLERLFWKTLEELASSQQMSMAHFVSKLYDEMLESQGDVKNLASLLRCCCLIYNENKGMDTSANITEVSAERYAFRLGAASAV